MSEFEKMFGSELPKREEAEGFKTQAAHSAQSRTAAIAETQQCFFDEDPDNVQCCMMMFVHKDDGSGKQLARCEMCGTTADKVKMVEHILQTLQKTIAKDLKLSGN